MTTEFKEINIPDTPPYLAKNKFSQVGLITVSADYSKNYVTILDDNGDEEDFCKTSEVKNLDDWTALPIGTKMIVTN